MSELANPETSTEANPPPEPSIRASNRSNVRVHAPYLFPESYINHYDRRNDTISDSTRDSNPEVVVEDWDDVHEVDIESIWSDLDSEPYQEPGWDLVSAVDTGSVAERLPLVELGKEEGLKDECVICAVCKEVVKLEEKVRRLPCRHYYHHDCIAPWLDVKRTCPYCRYEIRTDDLDCERRISSVPVWLYY